MIVIAGKLKCDYSDYCGACPVTKDIEVRITDDDVFKAQVSFDLPEGWRTQTGYDVYTVHHCPEHSSTKR